MRSRRRTRWACPMENTGVYLQLHSLLLDLTPQQVAGMTMRELRQLLADQANEAGAGGVGGPAAAPDKGLGNPFRGQGGAKRGKRERICRLTPAFSNPRNCRVYASFGSILPFLRSTSLSGGFVFAQNALCFLPHFFRLRRSGQCGSGRDSPRNLTMFCSRLQRRKRRFLSPSQMIV